jgi:hypothetical protein
MEGWMYGWKDAFENDLLGVEGENERNNVSSIA